MILCDRDIRNLCVPTSDDGKYVFEVINSVGVQLLPMIDPFSESVSGKGIVSFGLTSAGYDLRLARPREDDPDDAIRIFKNTFGEHLDPRGFRDPEYHKRVYDHVRVRDDGSFTIPPHCYVLGRSYEYLRIPKHLKATCVGKSTLARIGIVINTTPAEPEWDGYLTIEIGNITPCPVTLRTMEGICQMEFHLLSGIPDVTYADKAGIYQSQKSVTTARVRE